MIRLWTSTQRINSLVPRNVTVPAPKLSRSFPNARNSHTVGPQEHQWTQQEVIFALNQRHLLMREVRNQGVKKLVFSVGVYIVYKYVKLRFFGKDSRTESAIVLQ